MCGYRLPGGTGHSLSGEVTRGRKQSYPSLCREWRMVSRILCRLINFIGVFYLQIHEIYWVAFGAIYILSCQSGCFGN